MQNRTFTDDELKQKYDAIKRSHRISDISGLIYYQYEVKRQFSFNDEDFDDFITAIISHHDEVTKDRFITLRHHEDENYLRVIEEKASQLKKAKNLIHDELKKYPPKEHKKPENEPTSKEQEEHKAYTQDEIDVSIHSEIFLPLYERSINEKFEFADKIIEKQKSRFYDRHNVDADSMKKTKLELPESNISTLLGKQFELISKAKRIASGDKLINDIIKIFLQKINEEIKSKSWKAKFSGGIVIPGLNINPKTKHEDPVPELVAKIYQRVQSAFKDGDWQNAFADLDKFANTANKKAHEWNLFGKRDPSTIEFYKSFNKEFNQLKNRLIELKGKIKKDEDEGEKRGMHHR